MPPRPPLPPFPPSAAGSRQVWLRGCNEMSLFSSSASTLIIQLVLPGQPLAPAALHGALREIGLHADVPISRESSSGRPQPSSVLWPKHRNLRDGHSPKRPRGLGQCPCWGSKGGEQIPTVLLAFQVEGEAKLCPLTPTCSGGTQSAARPSTTRRSARRTSRCSSWKCGAFKTRRSHRGQPLKGHRPHRPAAVTASSATATSARHPPLHSQTSWRCGGRATRCRERDCGHFWGHLRSSPTV